MVVASHDMHRFTDLPLEERLQLITYFYFSQCWIMQMLKLLRSSIIIPSSVRFCSAQPIVGCSMAAAPFLLTALHAGVVEHFGPGYTQKETVCMTRYPTVVNQMCLFQIEVQ